MAVPFTQSNFYSGEIDKRLRRRNDLKPYYTGLAKADNILPTPQGGARQRPATAHEGVVRRQLQPVTLTAGMLTGLAPTSGSFANLVDGALATAATFPALGSAGVILTVDLGAIIPVMAMDLLQFNVPTAGDGGVDRLEWHGSNDGYTWVPMAQLDLRPSLNTRRAARAPGFGWTWRYIRLSGNAAMGAMTVAGVAVWQESLVKSPVNVLYHQDETYSYSLVVTDRHVDIWREDGWVAACALPYLPAAIVGLTSAHQNDTALIFHPDHPPQRVMRRDTEWHSDAPTFTNIPNEKYDGVNDEPIMSATRGWPACGAFWSQRLWLAGIRSRPNAVLISILNTPYDLNTSGTLATDGIRLDLEADDTGLPAIRRMRPGPRLELYTKTGFFYSSDTVVAKGTAFSFPLSERVPVHENGRVVHATKNAYFIEDGGAVIREVNFDDNLAERYSTRELSLFWTNLVAGARDLVRVNARTTHAATLLWVLRDDGQLVCGSLIKTQEVEGFAPMPLGGIVHSIGNASDISARVAVERGDRIHLERFDDTRTLDMSVIRPTGPMLTGLDHLNGRNDVWIRADERIIGPLTVSGGTLNVELATGQTCEVGVAFTWELEQLRLAGDAQRQVAFNRTIHCSVVTLELERASVFDMNVDDGDWREVEPLPTPAQYDPTLVERDFKGTHEEDGFLGSNNGAVKMRGLSVNPFHLIAITRECSW
jgi:hypothetical protein